MENEVIGEAADHFDGLIDTTMRVGGMDGGIPNCVVKMVVR